MSTPDADRDHGNDAFEGLLLLAHIVWAPFLWPLIGLTALVYAWGVYKVLF